MQFIPAKSLVKKREVPTKGINPTLDEERQRCNFDQEQVAEIMWGSKQSLTQFRKIRDLMAKDPILQNTVAWNDLERDEQMEDGYRKLNRKMKISKIPTDYKNSSLWSLTQNGGTSTSLHHIMFELTVRYLGDDEQVAKWLPKVLSCQMIGSYS